ncbi:3-hydroxybutyryl-CoA dehydrogenase [Aromatoleum petrolei]|uniref:3-hydroxybutyryl-CoA dehydrogenase n=1 Tax=Aromatoleum petrolei TaxID=76116 RepID=A0ABX1MWX4_9RHOO|nr:3-hydroxybutyryl-CoA dehydrogenase [Aromatoleum petrolei]NMF89562.1 3-hydroxybutyryl-CoA dehydrogenase [Aromatoleum petrolei]QTQ37339.1 3-hydroxybutanoyl-CoA dehydrogenase [Aromatoleum petrolei]
MTLSTVGVIGAGTMGNGIAQVCASSGMAVVMLDVSDEALRRGVTAIEGSLARVVKNGALSDAARSETLARIRVTTDYAALADCDFVIEAATENLELKKKILRQAGEATRPTAIVATNTSSLSVTELAAALPHPERFIGTHFFNPVPVMGLVEVIAAMQTSAATLETTRAFVAAIGKQVVAARNSPGFAVNRILVPMLNEAIFALQEGLATREDIDAGMRLGCNHPIGPLALADLIGLDTLLAVIESFYRGFDDPKYRPAPLLKEMVAAGYLGRKTGRGFFEY